MRGRGREQRVLEALIDGLRDAGIDPREVAEWLWEDFGVRARPNWPSIKRAARKGGVTPQDLVSLYDELSLEVGEDVWGE